MYGPVMVHSQLSAPPDIGVSMTDIATGFLRVGPWDNSSKLFKEDHKNVANHMADLTETTATVFLGLTMSCCRCHDHKTEPLLQSDHYRLRAFFAGTRFADDLPLDLEPEQISIRNFNADIDANGWPHPRVLGATVGIDTISHGVLTAMRFPDRRVFQSARYSASWTEAEGADHD